MRSPEVQAFIDRWGATNVAEVLPGLWIVLPGDPPRDGRHLPAVRHLRYVVLELMSRPDFCPVRRRG